MAAIVSVYERERPQHYDHGRSLWLALTATEDEIGEVLDEWQAKADACVSPVARREWLGLIAEMRAFLAEDDG